jgi:UDP-glucose 4-epimerase
MLSLTNKKILITGGTGSFGNAFINYILKNKIPFKSIKILSRDEKKQHDMREKYNNDKLEFIIGDVRDYKSIVSVVNDVDFIFHAAALKQVPSCEFFPQEAVKTNILGTENIIDAANDSKVKKIVFLSTDKSVNPINAMGMSKALMEKIILAKSRSVRNNLSLCITRYGNVIGSRGSVVPTFINQIRSNKPLTITDKSMTRFLMTLKEAIELVIFAFKNGKNGDLFVKKSSAATLDTISKAVKQHLKKKTKVINIGFRHGEKMHESLLSQEERIIAKDLGNYFRIKLDNKSLNYKKFYIRGRNLKSIKPYSSDSTKMLNLNETLKILKKSGVFNITN